MGVEGMIVVGDGKGGGAATSMANSADGFQFQICKTDTNKRNKIIKQKN
jgi:hypothetical protein